MEKEELLNKLKEALKHNKIKEANKHIEDLYEKDLYKDIANCLEESINKYNIEDEKIYFVLGTIYAQMGEYNKSIEKLEKAIPLFNKKYEEFFNKIPFKDGYSIHDKTDSANINDKVNTDSPEFSVFLNDLTDLFSNHIALGINLSINYIHKKDYEKAIDILNEVYDSPFIRQLKYSPFFYIANSLFHNHFYSLLYNRAKLFIKINELDKALKDLEELQTVNINTFPVALLMSYIYLIKKDYKNSIEYFNNTLILIDSFLKDDKLNKDIKYQYISEIYILYLEAKKLDNDDFKNKIKEGLDSIFDKFIKKEINNYKEKDNRQHNTIKNNSLFYYTKYDEKYTIDTINNEYIYLSDPNKFNDSIDPIIRYIDDDISKNILNKVAIACLTNTPYNILMWGHYGDKSQGICIEYDVEELVNNNIEDLYLIKMQYLDTLEYNKDDFYFESIFNNGLKKSLQLMDIFTIKHKEWSYEEESRIIKYSSNGFCENDNSRKLQLKIKSVYFGEKIEKKHKDNLIKILKNKNIPYYNIKHYDSNIFKLYHE